MQTCPCSRSVVLTLQSKNEWCGRRKTMLPSKLTWQIESLPTKVCKKLIRTLLKALVCCCDSEVQLYGMCKVCASQCGFNQESTHLLSMGRQPRAPPIKADFRLWVMLVRLFRGLLAFRFYRLVNKKIVSRLADHLSEWNWLSKRLCSLHCRPFRLPFPRLHSRCGLQQSQFRCRRRKSRLPLDIHSFHCCLSKRKSSLWRIKRYVSFL